MEKYGYDESASTPCGGVRGAFCECSQPVHSVYVTYPQNKSMVFGVQKYGFWCTKRGFLQRKKGVFERAYRYIGCVKCSNELCDRLLCTTLDGVFVCRKGRNKWIQRA